MATVKNRRNYPVDITGGRFISPNEVLNIDVTPDHEQKLIADGILQIVDGTVSPPAPLVTGGWKSPVDVIGNLPSTGNERGDVRLVFNSLAIYIWNGSAWEVAAGGATSPVLAQQNLFIQSSPPDITSITINTLYIATNVDGTPKDPSFWEVYSDPLWGGDGGNLIIQADPPNPTVDAWWAKLNPDGTPTYIDQWVVFTGRGNPLGIGNANLKIQKTEPVSPSTGTLFIPLDINEVALTPDNWKVYT